jgi:hypothetical protein
MELDRRYVRDADFVFRRISDEVILLPIRRNLGDLESIFSLNEVGARIWELLDGERSLAEIRDTLLAEFDASADAVDADLAEFVATLESIGAVGVAC